MEISLLVSPSATRRTTSASRFERRWIPRVSRKRIGIVRPSAASPHLSVIDCVDALAERFDGFVAKDHAASSASEGVDDLLRLARIQQQNRAGAKAQRANL